MQIVLVMARYEVSLDSQPVPVESVATTLGDDPCGRSENPRLDGSESGGRLTGEMQLPPRI